MRGHGRMPFNSVLNTIDLPNFRTQTKDNHLSSDISYIGFEYLPYLHKINTVLKRNIAVLRQNYTVLKRNAYRTCTKITRTQTKILPHSDEIKLFTILKPYLKNTSFLTLYVSKSKFFNTTTTEENSPYLNENLFFKRMICKKS